LSVCRTFLEYIKGAKKANQPVLYILDPQC